MFSVEVLGILNSQDSRVFQDLGLLFWLKIGFPDVHSVTCVIVLSRWCVQYISNSRCMLFEDVVLGLVRRCKRVLGWSMVVILHVIRTHFMICSDFFVTYR